MSQIAYFFNFQWRLLMISKPFKCSFAWSCKYFQLRQLVEYIKLKLVKSWDWLFIHVLILCDFTRSSFHHRLVLPNKFISYLFREKILNLTDKPHWELMTVNIIIARCFHHSSSSLGSRKPSLCMTFPSSLSSITSSAAWSKILLVV